MMRSRHIQARHGEAAATIALTVSVISVMATAFAAYITHVWWIIHLLMRSEAIAGGRIVIAALGILFPPFGMIHGAYLWFNAW